MYANVDLAHVVIKAEKTCKVTLNSTLKTLAYSLHNSALLLYLVRGLVYGVLVYLLVTAGYGLRRRRQRVLWSQVLVRGTRIARNL